MRAERTDPGSSVLDELLSVAGDLQSLVIGEVNRCPEPAREQIGRLAVDDPLTLLKRSLEPSEVVRDRDCSGGALSLPYADDRFDLVIGAHLSEKIVSIMR